MISFSGDSRSRPALVNRPGGAGLPRFHLLFASAPRAGWRRVLRALAIE